jgi:hypothetical protein
MGKLLAFPGIPLGIPHEIPHEIPFEIPHEIPLTFCTFGLSYPNQFSSWAIRRWLSWRRITETPNMHQYLAPEYYLLSAVTYHLTPHRTNDIGKAISTLATNASRLVPTTMDRTSIDQ